MARAKEVAELGSVITVGSNQIQVNSGGSASTPIISKADDTNTGIFFPAADTIAFTEGGVESMRIDSSGNVGIGVAPSAWSTTVPALQLGGGGAFLAALGSSPYVALGTNAHYNGTNFVYRTTNTASYYDQSSGLHRWYTAPSGTAGTNVTFTQAMTLDASGNLGIGTTSPTYTLEVAKGTSGQQTLANFRTANSTAANNAGIQIFATPSATAGSRNVLVSWDADGADTSGGDYFYIQKLGNSGNVELAQYSNAAMIFSTNVGTERMRIDSSGNVGIGISSPGCKLDVYNSAAAAANNEILRLRYVTSTTAGVSGDLNFANNTGTVLNRISSVIQDGSNVGLVFSNYGSGSLGERMRITAGGDLLVGTSSDLGSLARVNILSANGEPDIISMRYTNAGAGQYWRVVIGSDNTYYLINDDSVGVSLADGGTSWSAFSDERLKTDLKPIENAVNKVTTLRAVTGRYKTDEKGKSRSFLIAQDIQNVLPEAVSTFKQLKSDDETEYLSLSYTEVIPLLVAAIKEQQAMIEELKQEVAALKLN